MIGRASIAQYRGPVLDRGDGYVYIPPHPFLTPYIANYTITCPQQGNMPIDYTVLPSGSATLCYSLSESGIFDGLRGINTKASVVGAHAVQFDLLLLIEFHPAGLWPLIRVPQHEILDDSFRFADLDMRLHRQILDILYISEDIDALIDRLDQILMARLATSVLNPQLAQAMNAIMERGGLMSIRQLAEETCYSERQLRRIFVERLGMGINAFSRIVRVNRAIHMMQTDRTAMSTVAVTAGFYDQPHFIHDFQALCGVTPMVYMEKMSVFYNDIYKL